MRDLPLLAV